MLDTCEVHVRFKTVEIQNNRTGRTWMDGHGVIALYLPPWSWGRVTGMGGLKQSVHCIGLLLILE